MMCTVQLQSRSQSPQAFLSPGGTLGQWNGSVPGFLVQNNSLLHKAANEKRDILFDFPRVSSGNQPLTKKPEDSGIKIA